MIAVPAAVIAVPVAATVLMGFFVWVLCRFAAWNDALSERLAGEQAERSERRRRCRT